MKLDFNAILVGLDGKPMLGKDKTEATLKEVAVEALMAVTENDRGASGEDKFKNYELAAKVYAGGEIEITPEQAALLKRRIGECYGPVVVGPAYKLLNG